MKDNIDTFIGNVTKIGGSLAVVIPKNHVIFTDLKEGDLIKVYYKKTEEIK